MMARAQKGKLLSSKPAGLNCVSGDVNKVKVNIVETFFTNKFNTSGNRNLKQMTLAFWFP